MSVHTIHNLMLSRPVLIESILGGGILITLLVFPMILPMCSISAFVTLPHQATRHYRRHYQPMVEL